MKRKLTAKVLIKKLHKQDPKMTVSDIALSVVCSEGYVKQVLGIKKKRVHQIKWRSPYSRKMQLQEFTNSKDADFFQKLLEDKGRKVTRKTVKK